MGKFTMTHEINCDAQAFWARFFDRSFNEKLYLEALGYREFKLIEQNETDRATLYKIAAMPKMRLPGPVTKLLGDNYRYTEEGTFDKATQVYRWKQTPSVQPDKIRLEGNIRIEPIGDRKVRRTMEVSLEAKIFGVGGLLESTFEKQLREQADQTAGFFNKSLEMGATA